MKKQKYGTSYNYVGSQAAAAIVIQRTVLEINWHSRVFRQTWREGKAWSGARQELVQCRLKFGSTVKLV